MRWKRFMDQQRSNSPKGFAALIGVLILGSVAMIAAGSLAFAAQSTARALTISHDGHRARWLAHACANTALLSVHDNTAYAGSGTVNIDAESCQYVVTNSGGGHVTITVTAPYGDVVKHFTVTTRATTPVITIDSWRETAS